MRDFICNDERETRALAHKLAPLVQVGDVISLKGNLGAGKSFLTRELIRYFLPEENVPSPTFTLLQTYEIENGTLYHFDLYRLENAEEVYELGLDDALTDGISFIEWPERIDGLLPSGKLSTIEIEATGEYSRNIRITGLLSERLC